MPKTHNLWIPALTIITTWSTVFGEPCTIPEDVYDKTFTAYCPGREPTRIESGEVDPYCTLVIACEEGFFLGNAPNTSACTPFGTWTPELPHCRKMCETISGDPHLQLKCVTDNKEVSCDSVLLSETKLTQRCEPFYRSDRIEYHSEITCDANGKWSSHLINCIPDCGRDAFQVKNILEGEKEPDGYSPWQVAIFRQKKFICGGTIISERVVVSAAHCFSSNGPEPEDLTIYEIGVGKSDSSYKTDNTETVFHKVSKVRFPPFYKGRATLFVGDISLVILTEPIKFNAVVSPACVDRSKSITLTTGDKGKVSGWGANDKNKTTSLLTTNVTYTDFQTCWNKHPDSMYILTYDKFCTESRTGRGDSGGGFIYYHAATRSNYLYGIVSTKNDALEVGIFVNVSPYIDLIEEVLKESLKNRPHAPDASKDSSCLLPSKKNRSVSVSKLCRPNLHDRSKKATLANYCTITTTCTHSQESVNSVCLSGEWVPAVPECEGTEYNEIVFTKPRSTTLRTTILTRPQITPLRTTILTRPQTSTLRMTAVTRPRTTTLKTTSMRPQTTIVKTTTTHRSPPNVQLESETTEPYSCPIMPRQQSKTKKIACSYQFYPSFDIYGRDNTLYPENIDGNLCTHIVLRSITPSLKNGLESLPHLQDFDIKQGGLLRVTNLKKRYPDLKVIVNANDVSSNTEIFSKIAASYESRSEFKKNVVKFLRDYNFDGLDITWPAASTEERRKFNKIHIVLLLKELEEEFKKEAAETCEAKLGLSFYLPKDLVEIDQNFDVRGISKYVHYMHTGHFNLKLPFHHYPSTFHPAPLYPLGNESDEKTVTIDSIMNYMVKKNVDLKKILLGMNLAGISFNLTNQWETKMNSPGKLTSNMLFYNQICKKFLENSNWQHKYDDQPGLRPYAYNKNEWIAFEDESSVRMKAAYANSKNLGGICLSSLITDDYEGTCGSGKRFPMISAAGEALLGGATINGYINGRSG